mgnify:CR=1 FL=1|tara:strand:+ start:811 stop:1191 length:381 start_codon:yes stop_codon:yes gene_type:complete
MGRTYKQLLKVVERLGAFPEDNCGLELSRIRPPRDTIVDGKKYYLSRYGPCPEAKAANIIAQAKESGDGFTISAAQLTIAFHQVWSWGFKNLWQLDSILRMIEAGEEPKSGATYVMTRDLPALREE